MRLFDVDEFTSAPVAALHGELNATALGDLAERIVEARCMEQRLSVARVSSDVSGVDLIVERKRVQVKSTRRLGTHGLYQFNSGNGDKFTYSVRGSQCDVFALYAHDVGCLWLVPAEVVRVRWGRSTRIRFAPEGFDEWRDAWAVFS